MLLIIQHSTAIVSFQISNVKPNYSMICPCSLVNNNSKLPANLNHVTDKRLFSVTFSASDIAKIFQNLSSNIAHGHDNISIENADVENLL